MSDQLTVAWCVPRLNLWRAFFATDLGFSLASTLESRGIRVVFIGAVETALYGATRPHTNPMAFHAARIVWGLVTGPSLGRAFEVVAGRNLSVALQSLDVDVVISHRHYPGLPEAVRRSGAKLVLWGMDDPMVMGNHPYANRWKKLAQGADYVFTQSRGSVAAYRELGISRVEWLPLAFDPNNFDILPEGLKTYPVVFVGNYLPDRGRGNATLTGPLAKRYGPDLHIFGGNWPDLGCSLHPWLDRRNLGKVYPSAEVALNFHRDEARMCDCSLNLRVFEAMGLGAMLVCDDAKGIERLFSPGVDLVVARSPEETIELIDYYRANPEERERIGENGRRTILSAHTIAHRGARISEVLGQL